MLSILKKENAVVKFEVKEKELAEFVIDAVTAVVPVAIESVTIDADEGEMLAVVKYSGEGNLLKELPGYVKLLKNSNLLILDLEKLVVKRLNDESVFVDVSSGAMDIHMSLLKLTEMTKKK